MILGTHLQRCRETSSKLTFLGFAITDLTSVGVHLEAVRTPHHAHDVVAGDGDVFGRLADVSASVGAALLVGQTVTVVGAEVAADAKDAFFHGWAGTLVDDCKKGKKMKKEC